VKVHKYAFRDPKILFSKLTFDEKNFIGESNSLESAFVLTKNFKQKQKKTIDVNVSKLSTLPKIDTYA
jgi:hypothetical protein